MTGIPYLKVKWNSFDDNFGKMRWLPIEEAMAEVLSGSCHFVDIVGEKIEDENVLKYSREANFTFTERFLILIIFLKFGLYPEKEVSYKMFSNYIRGK